MTAGEVKDADVSSIRERLDRVEERIQQACRRAGRAREDITLVAVSKTFSIEVVEAAREAGLRYFGENRAREMRDKARVLPGEVEGGDVQWHMIGHCQRNKAKFVVRHADVFHALDSPRLADELNKRAGRKNRVLPCFVQVNASGESQKYGIAPDETHAYLDSLAEYDHLHVIGLMMMATYTEDPETVRPEFRQVRRLKESYRDEDHPVVDLDHLSMGMSGDFEVAIEEGATFVRLGSALFGSRSH